MDTDGKGEEHAGIDRRRMLQLGGAVVAAGWVAPLVLTSPASAATTSGIPVNPLCNGQTCGNFTKGVCHPNPVCACFETPNGQGICEDGTELCAELVNCPNGQGDCPAGSVCIANSCCEIQVCIVLTTTCGNLPPDSKPHLKAPLVGSGPRTASR